LNECREGFFAHVIALSEMENAELGGDVKRFLGSISGSLKYEGMGMSCHVP
jgi:hypothetical protein